MPSVHLVFMDDELTALDVQDLNYSASSLSIGEIKAVFTAYDVHFIRNFGSDLFYVEMTDGEPLVPMNPKSSYPPGIEKIFDLMARGRISILICIDGEILKKYFQVDENEL